MRDVYKEYKRGLISWDKAYFIANNETALCKENNTYSGVRGVTNSPISIILK